jgi:hypothetical protein
MEYIYSFIKAAGYFFILLAMMLLIVFAAFLVFATKGFVLIAYLFVFIWWQTHSGDF